MALSGKYRFLHKYLDERYADIVVLTLRQIEDLSGFALPSAAHTNADWWTHATDQGWSDAWTMALRTARPNLIAGHVVFERLT